MNISMSADLDRLLKTVIESLQDWWAGMGELAWVLAGVLLLVGIATLLLLLRWIGGGGLSPPRWSQRPQPLEFWIEI